MERSCRNSFLHREFLFDLSCFIAAERKNPTSLSVFAASKFVRIWSERVLKFFGEQNFISCSFGGNSARAVRLTAVWSVDLSLSIWATPDRSRNTRLSTRTTFKPN